MYKYFFYLFFLVILIACQKPEIDNSTVVSYFDLPAVISTQQKQLKEQHAGIEKNLKVNKKLENIKIDSVDWDKELQLFVEANINKPVLIGSYKVDEKKEGDLSKITYTTLDDKNKVKELIVTKTGEVLNTVEVDWVESNPIYHSEKQMKLDFENNKLLQFTIDGYQKMVADDTLYYNLEAHVIYDRAMTIK